MKKINNKIKVLLLFLTLCLISIITIIILGDTYTYKTKCMVGLEDINDYGIIIEQDNILECIDKKVEDGYLVLKLKSKAPGKVDISITNAKESQTYNMRVFYVHKFGIITYNDILGDCTGCKTIPISLAITLSYIVYLLIIKFRKSIKQNIYQYKNIAYLGMIIFTSFTAIYQINTIFNYQGLITTIDDMMKMFSFPIIILPIAFVVSILVILSNLSLIKKEGFNLRNILGIALGIFLCFTTMLPDLMYKALYSATWIDVHNENSIGLYIYEFFESLPIILISYIECILIGTIIISLKAAKHIPNRDKNYIIILGCKIKKDGSLTNLLKGRVDRAIEFSKIQKEETNKDIIFVPSGGKGSDEVISEAEAMKNYLVEQGISEKNILVENKSKNTQENIAFSNKLINNKEAKIAFSTTNYHVFRAGCIGTEQKISMEGIGAKTKSYFWVNAFIREFIATLVSEKKKHIAVLLGITILCMLMAVLKYFNVNGVILG